MRALAKLPRLGGWGTSLAWAALVAGLLATFTLWLDTERAAQARTQRLLAERVQVVEARLAQQLAVHAVALGALAASIDAGGERGAALRAKLTPDLQARMPALVALAHVPVRSGRAGLPDVHLLEADGLPPAGQLAQALAGSETAREALRRATLRRSTSLSHALSLRAGDARHFLLVVPRFAATPVSAEPQGHVIGVIDPQRLLAGTLADVHLDTRVEVFDGASAQPALKFFDSDALGHGGGRRMRVVLPVAAEGSTWTLSVAASDALEGELVSHPARAVLVAGIAVSLLLFFSLHWLASGQSRAALLALRMSDAARARARRFSELARHAPVCVFIANPAGDFVFVNQRWYEWTGLNESSANGRGWLAALGADERQRVARAWNDAVAAGEAMHDEFRLLANDGRERYVACSAVPERDEHGHIVAFIGTWVDITARREAELALRRANEELEGRVRQRTGELEQVNSDLSREIDERTRAAEALRHSNARLHALVAELGLRAKARAALNEVGSVLGVCDSLEEGFNAVVGHIAAVFPHGAGCLYWFGIEGGEGRRVADWGEAAGCALSLRAGDCWALRRGQPHHLERGSGGLPCDHVHRAPAAGSVCVPLTARGRLLALLYWEAPSPPVGAEDAELWAEQEATWRNWAVSVGEYLQLAVANLMLRQSLEAQVRRDPLTDLYNRRYMEEALERELRRAERSQRPMGLIMMDLDHFKAYNDSFGHHAGDLLLVALANCLRGQVRGGDIVCRYGGEEFLVILPETSLELVLQRAEHLRRTVAEQMTELAGKERTSEGRTPITMSLGVALYPVHGASGVELIRAADAALYRAKHLGRNRVEVADGSGSPLAERS